MNMNTVLQGNPAYDVSQARDTYNRWSNQFDQMRAWTAPCAVVYDDGDIHYMVLPHATPLFAGEQFIVNLRELFEDGY